MKNFTKLLIILIVTTLAGCQSLKLPQHVVGQIYRDAFAVNSRNAVPLPPGEWTLASYQREFTAKYHLITYAVLMQTSGKQLVRFVDVYAQQEETRIENWWILPGGCLPDPGADFASWVLHEEKVVDLNLTGSSAHDCWRITTWWMSKDNNPDSWYWNQAITYAQQHGIQLPEKAVVVYFAQSSGRNFHSISYGYNAAVDGGIPYTNNLPSQWKRANYANNANRRNYINAKKTWANQWRAKVHAGITGKLPIDTEGSE